MARILDVQPAEQPVAKKSFFSAKKGFEGVKKGFQTGGGAKALLDPLVGAAKGVGSTVSGLSSLGERAIKGTGRLLTPKKFEEKLGFAKEDQTAGQTAQEKFFTPTSGFQKAGFGLEQIAEFAVPGALGAKAGKGAGLGARVLEGALTTGGVTAAQEGEFGKEALIGAAIGGGLPVLASATGAITGGAKRLIRKSLGLTGQQSKKLNIIAKTKDPNTGKNIYEGIEDFARKKGIIGQGKEVFSRPEMKQHADSLLETTLNSKRGLITNIKGSAPNKFQKITGLLQKKLGTLNKANAGVLDDQVKFINSVANKKKLSGSEIDQIRSIADDLVFSEQDKILSKQIRELITPLRKSLDKLDKTGTLKTVNTDIRLLKQLLGDKGFLTAAVEKDIAGRGIGFGGAALGASAIPGVGQLAAPLLGFEAISSIPQIAAPLGRGLLTAAESAAAPAVAAIARGATAKGTNRLFGR